MEVNFFLGDSMAFMQKEFLENHEKVKSLLRKRVEKVRELKEETLTLLQMEADWRIQFNEIILNTDFKGLYKKDNEQIRNAHIQEELTNEYDDLQLQKMTVKYLKMDISQIDKEIDIHDKILTWITANTMEE